MRAIFGLLTLISMLAVASAAEKVPAIEKSPPNTCVATTASTEATVFKDAVDGEAPTQRTSVSFKAEHPGDTALSQDEHGQWQIRSFPGLATLYVYDKDTLGTSNCGAPCTSAWAPLLASRVENGPVGDWTLIARPDGRRQWAYKGQPVYLRYHDLPAHKGDVQSEGFRKLDP